MSTLTGLLIDGETVETPLVILAPMTVDDLASMAWIEGALAPDWGMAELEGAVGEGRGVLVLDKGGAPIGAMVVMRDAPVAGAACVPLIAIEPSRRYRGLGSAAGLALERHLRRRFGVEKVYAPVPDGRGLAVYFWLRLGYRPLTRSEAPWGLVGLSSESRQGIWMLRDAE